MTGRYRDAIRTARRKPDATESVPGLFPDTSAETLGTRRHGDGRTGLPRQQKARDSMARDQAIRIFGDLGRRSLRREQRGTRRHGNRAVDQDHVRSRYGRSRTVPGHCGFSGFRVLDRP